jgi:NAD(P)-dependent dehydrogenase (short-subunit alcohol dehydrogenase family)
MTLASALDTALDRTVALSYGSTGLSLRRRLSNWPDDPPRMDGKVVVVTGATAGLGLAAAQGFAALGATVHVVGRNERKVEQVTAGVKGGVPGVCDVSSLASLKAFTDGWTGPLDVLVNNAGVMPPQRTLTSDGIELTFATNVIGPFWLTRRLPLDGARVITVASGGMYGQRLDRDLQNEDYTPVKAYARTKRCEVVLTELFAARMPATTVHSMHPGWADTPGVQESLSTFSKLTKPILRTPEQGADTIVWLGGSPVPLATSGLFWHDRRPRPTHLFGLNRETEADRQHLWAECVRLTGLAEQE